MTDATASSGADAPTSIAAPNISTKAPAAPAAQAPAPDFRGTKHKVKVGGQERDVSYDELIRDYQLQQASHEKLQQASRKEKDAAAVFEALERGDFGYVEQKLGPAKARAAAEKYLIEKLEYDELPDVEKRSRQLEAENKGLKGEAQQRKETAEREEYERTVAHAHQELDQEIAEALKGYKNPTPRLVLRLLNEIDARLDARHQRIPVAEAKKHAVESIFSDIEEYLPQLSPEELIQRLPKSVLDAIRKHEVSKVMGEKSGQRVSAKGEKTKAGETRPKTQQEWFQTMEKNSQNRKRG